MPGSALKPKLTAVSILHYVRLVYRSLLFLGFLGLYLYCRLQGSPEISAVLERRPLIVSVIVWEIVVPWATRSLRSRSSRLASLFRVLLVLALVTSRTFSRPLARFAAITGPKIQDPIAATVPTVPATRPAMAVPEGRRDVLSEIFQLS